MVTSTIYIVLDNMELEAGTPTSQLSAVLNFEDSVRVDIVLSIVLFVLGVLFLYDHFCIFIEVFIRLMKPA